jgi:Sec-independent protein translocase protein TatA
MGIENPIHLLFIGAAALIFLGPRRLPDLAKALGHGIREFRESINLGEDDAHTPPPAAAATAQAAPPAAERTEAAPAEPGQAATAQASPEPGQAATAQASPEAPVAPPQS